MSDPREQLVRDLFESWNSGVRELDPEQIGPDPIVHSALTGGEYRGEAEVRTWMAEIDDQFDSWRLSIHESHTVEPDHVLVIGAVHFRGRASGVEFEQPMSWLFRFAGGRLVEMWNFSGHETAGEAARSISS